jgi:transcriptional regulator with XRE-family HTH domain
VIPSEEDGMAGVAKWEHAGRMMRQGRQGAGLTQEQTAHQLGVSHVTVSRWDRGKLRPNPGILRRAADLYDIAYEPLARAYDYLAPQAEESNNSDDLRERVASLEAHLAMSDRLRERLLRLSERDRRAVEALVDQLLGE